MSKKKSPNKAPVNQNAAQTPAAPVPVTQGNVFATFIEEARSIGAEVTARRALHNEVAAFLQSKGLIEEFEAFRKARQAPVATPPVQS